MLEVRHIDKVFNPGTINETVLFQDFNLTINEGEFVSVIGSNGSGKTTLLNVICGSLPVDNGDIILRGESVRKMKEYKRMKKIGRVYQDPSKGTCPSMTILENLSMADRKGHPFGLGLGVNKDRIAAYKEQLARLGLSLEDKLDIAVGALSGGQRQALALLMATMTPLDFLILDEHTAALDPKTANIIMQLTDEIVREKKITTIMVTHNLRFAVDYGDRMLMMHRGRAILDKSAAEKEATGIDDLLERFNVISIEAGNSV